MAVAQFNTPKVGSSSGSSNTGLYIVGGLILLYLGYTYIVKPELEKKKLEAAKK